MKYTYKKIKNFIVEKVGMLNICSRNYEQFSTD